MAKNFGRSFTKTFVPTFQQSYGEGGRYALLKEREEQDRIEHEQQKQTEIAKAQASQNRELENQKLFRLLAQGYEEVPALTGTAQISLGKERKADIISKLNITPNEKFQQITELNKPEKEMEWFYPTTSKLAYRKDTSGRLIPTDVENPLYKPEPKITFERTEPKINPKLGKWEMIERKFKDGVLQDENVKYENVKENDKGFDRLSKNTKSILDNWNKKRMELSSELSAGITAKAYQKDGDWMALDKKGEEVTIKDLRDKRQSELKESNAMYADQTKQLMSPDAQKLTDMMYNTANGNKKAKTLPSPNDFRNIVKQNFDAGNISTDDLELFRHLFRATYNREYNAR